MNSPIPHNFRHERVFRDRYNPLDSMNDNELYDAIRFCCRKLLIIFDELADVIRLCQAM